jgi:hypothetical protein
MIMAGLMTSNMRQLKLVSNAGIGDDQELLH